MICITPPSKFFTGAVIRIIAGGVFFFIAGSNNQLARGIAVARNKYYEIGHNFPFITEIVKKEDDNYYYVEPGKIKNENKVKFTINDEATKALFSYTPFVTSKLESPYGGNALFWWFWDELGFNR